MPLYSYRCTDQQCNHEFDERTTSYDTEREAVCPKCGKPAQFFMPIGSRNGVKFLFNYVAED